ncbi:shikimate kinase [Algoriphagus sediminis]|uniref:Shikimate kinase n=1 Tax=Algoriphagus sediminis TaxID=3057113 RepID=A0ABT7Y897_9BACT|nr:shikimate kinase [Algoriphagus sediminis]MDN3202726.1 shikimate kinase [Algoriphagus sediminis]
MKVVLVGLPGSGKSTFGKQLASAMEVDFFDLDQLIEARVGQTIPDIFMLQGEEAFRKIESSILRETLERKESLVLASGGGAPCYKDNMAIINEFATSVYLNLPLESISSRLSNSKNSTRPMFAGLDKNGVKSKLSELMEAREPYYEQSKIKLSGEDFSAELLIFELARELKN